MGTPSKLEIQAMELHRHNLTMLGPRDVVVASYPGSGSALVGNILLELGFEFVDLYTEVLAPGGGSSLVPELAGYRTRLRAMAARDRSAEGRAAGTGTASAADEPGARPRFAKDNLYPHEHAGLDLGGAVILVRDPRDTVHSSYRWFRGFSPIFMPDAPKGQGSFAEFLDGVGINQEPPIAHWAAFYRAWMDALPAFARSAVVRFEDLKADPVTIMTDLLTTFGAAVDRAEVRQAVQDSSFALMRAHEDQVAGAVGGSAGEPARINRRGKVGEWREWYDDPGLAARFQEPALLRTAARFGYVLTPSPEAAAAG
jgi:hypothetical protein